MIDFLGRLGMRVATVGAILAMVWAWLVGLFWVTVIGGVLIALVFG